LKPFGGCEVKVNTRAALTAAIKGYFFFDMETNYLKQLEDALINAAIEKQIHLERMANEDWNYASAIENLLRYKKRQYWIQRGIELFSDENQDTFAIIFQ
jgi:hypothetical protein